MSAITVENLTKIYKLYNDPKDRFREAVNPFKKVYSEPFYALRDISFRVEKGETVGIIGTNGSGKSTILKIITGVIRQTEGQVEVNGKVSALLELGAGFDMEYSGIDNIFMNGAVLGFNREQMEQKKDEILEFADIGDFVYQPVKTYSSGMLVRLAFALAINVEPEILIIDEALAVGDAFFQAKCFHKLEEIKASGTTILFVSHDIVSVKKLCSRAIWIEKGILREIGPSGEVCEKYMSAQIIRTNEENEKILAQMKPEDHDDVQNMAETKETVHFPPFVTDHAEAMTMTGKAELLSFYILDADGRQVNLLETRKKYKFGIVGKFNEDVERVIFGFELENLKGLRIFGINNFMQQKSIAMARKGMVYEVTFEFELPRFCKGEYLVTPAISSGTQDSHVVLVRAHNCQTIVVDNDGYNLAMLELDAETNIHEYDGAHVEIR